MSDQKALGCPFCEIPAQRVIHRGEMGVVIRDAYPVSPGHTLLIPVRHFGSFFELFLIPI